jgi:hypothetical protein
MKLTNSHKQKIYLYQGKAYNAGSKTILRRLLKLTYKQAESIQRYK